LTRVGRALSKHPNIVGRQSQQKLIRDFKNNEGVNQAAAEALQGIMFEGEPVQRVHPNFGPILEYKLATGLGARFHAGSDQFIGFLGRGLNPMG